MPIYKNNQRIASVYKGTQKIAKVYKGNSLVYTSDPVLPSGYTKMSYIVNDTYASGFMLNNFSASVSRYNLKIKMTIKIMEHQDGSTLWNWGQFFYVSMGATNDSLKVCWGSFQYTAYNLGFNLVREKRTIEISYEKGIVIDGTKVADLVVGDNEPSDYMGFFQNYNPYRLYDFQMSRTGDNVKIAHFVPALENQSGRYGFYDVVNPFLWTKFDYNNDILGYVPYKNIPSGWKQVEYIQNTDVANLYIDMATSWRPAVYVRIKGLSFISSSDNTGNILSSNRTSLSYMNSSQIVGTYYPSSATINMNYTQSKQEFMIRPNLFESRNASQSLSGGNYAYQRFTLFAKANTYRFYSMMMYIDNNVHGNLRDIVYSVNPDIEFVPVVSDDGQQIGVWRNGYQFVFYSTSNLQHGDYVD